MATTPPSTHAADTEVAGEQAGRRSRSRVDGDDRWILAIAVLVLAPLVVTLLGLIGAHWHPTFDWALEVLRIGDVGGRHTPFVGVQSRFGWDHPGPLLFWWSAPFHWLFGNTGVLVGIGLLNGAVIAGSVLVARRRGGLPLVAVFAVVLLLLLQGHRVDLLIDPWNPWVAVLPFLCYVLLAWSVAERDDPMLPWLVVVGTFLVQTHVGYAPLVVGLAGIAALGAWRGHGRDAEPRPTLRRDLRRALVVGVVLWIPPFLQQVTGDPGNLGEMLDFFRNPTEPGAGWLTSLRIMANELSLPGPWITGDDLGPLGLGLSRNPAGATLLLGGVAVLGVPRVPPWCARPRSARGRGSRGVGPRRRRRVADRRTPRPVPGAVVVGRRRVPLAVGVVVGVGVGGLDTRRSTRARSRGRGDRGARAARHARWVSIRSPVATRVGGGRCTDAGGRCRARSRLDISRELGREPHLGCRRRGGVSRALRPRLRRARRAGLVAPVGEPSHRRTRERRRAVVRRCRREHRVGLGTATRRDRHRPLGPAVAERAGPSRAARRRVRARCSTKTTRTTRSRSGRVLRSGS